MIINLGVDDCTEQEPPHAEGWWRESSTFRWAHKQLQYAWCAAILWSPTHDCLNPVCRYILAGACALRAGHQHQQRRHGDVPGAASAGYHLRWGRRQLRLSCHLRCAVPPGTHVPVRHGLTRERVGLVVIFEQDPAESAAITHDRYGAGKEYYVMVKFSSD